MFLRWKWIEETSCQCLIVFRRSCHFTWNFVSAHEKGDNLQFVSTSEERPPFSCEDRCLHTGLFWPPKLPIIKLSPPHDPLFIPSTVPVGMWSPEQHRGASAASCLQPVCSVKHRGRCRQRCSSGGEGRSKQQHVPVSCCLLLVITQKLSCALFLVLNRSWGNLITGRHTLHSGDCGWHLSEISIASTVQAVSLQRPSWTTGLICLYHTLPSYDLIWLNVWLREEDWPKPQLGILFPPVFVFCVGVFSSDWTLSEETSEDVCLLCWSCVQPSSEVCCSMEMKYEQAKLFTPFWHRWKESTPRTPPLPQILLGDLFILPTAFHKFKAT